MTHAEVRRRRRGDYTQECYEAAGWGTPPERYWLDAPEVERRLAILDSHYTSIGIQGGGRRVSVDFDAEPTALAS